jgi:glycerol uptake facilitator protein
MTPFLGELVGTALLILLGDGVVANVVLPRTNGHASGWIVITFGWAMAVFVAVFAVAGVSGAHLNPAVTLGLALAGKFAWSAAPAYVAAQLLGAVLGAALVWLVYRPHLDLCDDPAAQRAVFCCAPAVRAPLHNLAVELIATAVLVFGVLRIEGRASSLGSVDALPVALLVLAIGLSLGGPTGYAINPARDLGPRVAHALLPMRHKGPSDWPYAWIPVVGPLLGAALVAGLAARAS